MQGQRERAICRHMTVWSPQWGGPRTVWPVWSYTHHSGRTEYDWYVGQDPGAWFIVPFHALRVSGRKNNNKKQRHEASRNDGLELFPIFLFLVLVVFLSSCQSSRFHTVHPSIPSQPFACRIMVLRPRSVMISPVLYSFLPHWHWQQAGPVPAGPFGNCLLWKRIPQ